MYSLVYSYSILIYGMMEDLCLWKFKWKNFAECLVVAAKSRSSFIVVASPTRAETPPRRAKRPLNG